MRTRSLGWATDLAVLELTGSIVEERQDHVLVRTPANPDFHWGNCLLVTDEQAVDDADRWVAAFESAFPDADWVAVGLARMPADRTGWGRHGVQLEVDDVLAAAEPPRRTAPPTGYVVRELAGLDWEQFVARDVAVNAEGLRYEEVAHERFARARIASQRALVARGAARFVGAFADGRLVAELGIVDCGGTARYQTVATAPEHRGTGLASHLLGVAGAWAAARGCTQWVIVTEATNPAGRVYRRAGFEPVAPIVQAYRMPPRAVGLACPR
ncbi:GNAT family N-acetyltransferase [Mycobacterium yunnanensis]|uniref:GNAT family N-acetyltransferase n=1 Tax=Mycobacterium yunnanensis TaxID=368477 RepID=A0A9X2YZ80_9MYCO|nr:GNAT family N-acetyltransferase [Mycobacterium yunnanensis]MCV7420241.1 GNAT family N-acetyltransferase [Mycobacterium yunnanensis]